MRPTSQPQSALRTPLNHLLGREANVRILRVLATAGAPLGRGELARRAALQASGVRLVVDRLATLGVIELVGTGARQQVRWREEYPLAPLLRGLFEAEAARVERLTATLKRAAGALAPPPNAVWIEGPFAVGADRRGDMLLIGVVTTSGDAERVGERFRGTLAEIERVEDVTIELRVRSRADLAALPWAEREVLARATSVFGLPPEALVGAPTKTPGRHRGRTHADQDARALALAAAIAAKLTVDPGLIPRTRQQIARRMAEASPREQAELREWDLVLRTMSLARLRSLLTDRGERATRLRQTLPFLGILSPAERATALQNVNP